jgi:hypothetical protein
MNERSQISEVFCPIVQPTASLPALGIADLFHGSPIGTGLV